MTAINFNPAQHEPSAAQEAIPAAWYTAMITESEYKQSGPNAKDPNGFYYSFKYTITEGPYKGRSVYALYNVVNMNPVAVDIANGDLSALYHAIHAQTENITATEQLHNRPLEVKVGIRPARGDYEASNDIRGYRAVGSGTSTPVAGGAPAIVGAPPIAPPAAAAPPVAPAPAAPAPAPAPAAPPIAIAPPVAPVAPALDATPTVATAPWEVAA